MKRRAKTFIVLLFVCLFMAMPLINASALELTVEDMKENLVEKGLPEEYLQKLSDTHIKSLYEDGCQYILEYEEETAYLSEFDEEADDTNPGIVPYGHIDETMFKLKISKTTIKESNNLVRKVNLVVNYEWVKNPMNTKTDGITVNWDNSVFAYLGDSFYSYDEILVDGEYRKRVNECTAPDLAQQGGIGYSAEIGMYVGPYMSAGWARGTASFYIIPTSNIYEKTSSTSTHVTSINVNYVHDKTPIFGSISFSVAGVGVTINAPVFNDSLSRTLNFYY